MLVRRGGASCAFRRDSKGLKGCPVGDGAQQSQQPIFQERHYTVKEIAKLLNLSCEKTRELFEDEVGVLVIGSDASRGKRGYHILRIPESVVERVYRRLRNPDLTAGRPKAYPANSRGPQVMKAPESL